MSKYVSRRRRIEQLLYDAWTNELATLNKLLCDPSLSYDLRRKLERRMESLTRKLLQLHKQIPSWEHPTKKVNVDALTDAIETIKEKKNDEV